MKIYSSIIAVLLWNFLNFEKCAGLVPLIKRNVSELITTRGYPVEEYTVQTADGYILSLQRIPHGKNQQNAGNCKREVVFLMHGILCDSGSFVANIPDQSLGFELADGGHDVWLGNMRGNRYSRKHIKLTPDMKEFWQFSFSELGAYDVPAMIDFVLNQTKEEQLIYIGFSQGTSGMFALLSESPEFNQKVKLFIALAPVVKIHHMTSLVRLGVPFKDAFAYISALMCRYSIATTSILDIYLKSGACNRELKLLCNVAFFGLFGYDPYQLNETRLSFYSTLITAGTSIRTLVHYGQVIKAKQFQKFDYGVSGNMQHYNQATPPIYDVTKITTPVVLMWGPNDAIADPTDVHDLEKRLPSLAESYRVPYDSYSHIDFIFAIDNHKLLNQKIIQVLCKGSNSPAP